LVDICEKLGYFKGRVYDSVQPQPNENLFNIGESCGSPASIFRKSCNDALLDLKPVESSFFIEKAESSTAMHLVCFIFGYNQIHSAAPCF